MNIYVGNLDYRISEQDLRDVFSEYGEVESVKLVIDRETGKSKGFGFVVMVNPAEATKAIEDLNGALLENREMRVNEARPMQDNRSGGGGGGGRGGWNNSRPRYDSNRGGGGGGGDRGGYNRDNNRNKRF